MRKILALLAVGVLCSGLGFLQAADEGKTITVKGEGMCAKCALKEKGVTKCQNVVIEMKDGKKTTYYLGKNKFSDEAHKGLGLCTATMDEPVQIEVTGTWEKKGDKLILTPTEKIKKID